MGLKTCKPNWLRKCELCFWFERIVESEYQMVICKKILAGCCSLFVLCSSSLVAAEIDFSIAPKAGMNDYDWTLTVPYNWENDAQTNQISIQGLVESVHGFCLEIETFPGETSENPDTVIFHPYTDSWPVSDNDGSGDQSKIRLWLDGVPDDVTGYWQLDIENGGGLVDFRLGMTRLNLNRSRCTTGQSHTPWLRIGLEDGRGNRVLANGNMTTGAPPVP